MTFLRTISATVVLLAVVSTVAGMQTGQPANGSLYEEVPRISLAQATDAPATVEREVVVEREERIDAWAEEEWIIWAPIRMRSANPQATGTVRLLNTMDYSTASDGTDDDFLYRGQVIYGIAPNHHISLAVPVQLFDGSVEGNANLEFGWQWRLWDEQDWVPAFALHNELFIPSGDGGSGVDWRLTGLITKSLTSRWRVHANPFLMVNSGDSPWPTDRRCPGDLRDFRWGFVTGTEYLLTDQLSILADYVHEASEYYGHRNQHYVEVGTQWAISERHGLGFGTRWTLDGDRQDDNFGAALTYSYTFNAPAIGQ